jgi:hypothetical protein
VDGAALEAESLEWVPRDPGPGSLGDLAWLVAALFAGVAVAVGLVAILRAPPYAVKGLAGVAMFLSVLIVGWWRSRRNLPSHRPRIRAGRRGLTIVRGTDEFIAWDDIGSVHRSAWTVATEVRDPRGGLIAKFPLALGDVLRRVDGRTATLADLIVQEADGRLVADIRLGQATLRPRAPGEPRTPIDALQDSAQRVAEQFVMVMIVVVVIGAIAVLALR